MQAATSLQTLLPSPASEELQSGGTSRLLSSTGSLNRELSHPSEHKPCDLVELSRQLSEMIQAGNLQQAQEITQRLTYSMAHLEITPTLQPPAPTVSVKVNFEDLEASHGFAVLDLRPTLTIEQLKWKMLLEHGVPPEVQVWIIKRRIPKNADTLEKCGLTPGIQHSIYLYLASRESVGLTSELYQQKYGAIFGYDPDQSLHEMAAGEPEVTAPSPTVTQSRPSLLDRSLHSAEGEVIVPPVAVATHIDQQDQTAETVEVEPEGWKCPTCTLINIPTRPGCEVCSEKRPLEYVVPENCQIPDSERRRLELEQFSEQQLHEVPDNQPAEQQRLADMLADNDMLTHILNNLSKENVNNLTPFIPRGGGGDVPDHTLPDVVVDSDEKNSIHTDEDTSLT